MSDGLRLLITAVGAPLVAWVMWVKIAQPLGRFIISKISDPEWREFLTKDRGGYY